MVARRSASIVSITMLTAATALGQRGADPDKPTAIGLNELFSLCRPDHAKSVDTGVLYQTLGVLRRTPELDKQGRFALVHPVAACCANGIAVGLCVKTDRVTRFENGTQREAPGARSEAEVDEAMRAELGLD